MRVISAHKIQKNLSTTYLGRNLDCIKSVDSTNLFLLREPQKTHGQAVIAETQTKGKGQNGKSFLSPNGGLYLSVMLRPKIPLDELPLLTVLTAVSVIKALKSVFDLDAEIRRVNDIYLNGKKLCGILSEAAAVAGENTAEFAVVGLGVNIKKTPPKIIDIAVSLGDVTTVNKSKTSIFTATILNELEKAYYRLLNGEKDALIMEYNAWKKS